MGDMAAETRESNESSEQQPAESVANDEAAQREAYDYWGYLLKPDKCGTPKLDRLLKGIAQVISREFEPSDSPDLTPSQIAAWYRAVGGNYDVLFNEAPPSSIAFIYRSLGAFHSLQPAADDDGYSAPATPALKKQGFVTWQTIQLLLGPQEHVPFLQKSVERFDVVDPETNQVFLKMLPSHCFPDKPDEAMEAWYEGVAARLRREAEAEASGTRVEDESRSSAGDASSADEKTGAFQYFEDPMYRKSRPRPTFMRHVSKEQARASNDHGPVSRVRHMLNPFSRRRSVPPGRHDDSLSDEDATPIAPIPPATQRYPTHKRPHPPRRESSLTTTDSDSDPEKPPSRRRTPVLRHRRSHDSPVSPREYFPSYHEPYRPSPQHLSADRQAIRSSRAPSPQPVYGPTKSPLFATHVAQMQARNYYDRPAMPARTSYRPVPAPNVRYASQTTPVSPQRDVDPPYTREQDRYSHRDRDASYEGGSSHHGSSQSHRRHSSTGDAMYPRERAGHMGRTRSHDRVTDEWGEGKRDRSRDTRGYDRSREHSRDRERDRDRHRGSHRYVAGVEGGVSGRRYPVVHADPY